MMKITAFIDLLATDLLMLSQCAACFAHGESVLLAHIQPDVHQNLQVLFSRISS